MAQAEKGQHIAESQYLKQLAIHRGFVSGYTSGFGLRGKKDAKKEFQYGALLANVKVIIREKCCCVGCYIPVLNTQKSRDSELMNPRSRTTLYILIRLKSCM